MTLRAAAYLRVSSSGQRDRQTIDGQRRVVPDYIAAMGWVLVGVYEDDGHSAWTGKLDARLGYARLVADARAGRFDVVVVVAVDRLTRSEDPAERAEIVARLSRAGVKIAIVGAGIQDPRSLAGDLFLSVMGALAAAESRIKSERTIAGHVTAAGRGRKPRGRTPYGLTYDQKTGAWGVDPIRSGAIREAFRRTALGDSTSAIAHDLERAGFDRPRGGRWDATQIHAIIASDVYAGRFVVDVERDLAVDVPALVDADLVAEARASLAARHRHPPTRVVHHWLLPGLARCSLCRAAIGMREASYRCLHRRQPPLGEPRCALPLLQAATLDAWIWDSTLDHLGRRDVVDRLFAADGPADAPDPDKHRAELARIEKLQETGLDQIARGLIPPALADRHMRRLRDDHDAASSALKDALAASIGLRAVTDRAVIDEALADLLRGAELATAETRRRLFPALAASVTIGPRHVTVETRIAVPTMAPGLLPSWRTHAMVPIHFGTIRVALPRAS